MPRLIPQAGSDKPRPLKTEADTQRYTPTPRRNPRNAPTVGIFDAPYRCLRINLEWWSHISGMIDTLSSEELWIGDSEEQARALRQIAALLAYDACEGFEMTPEEFREANYESIYKAINDVAKQIVSGVTTGIVVDDDGNVVVGGGDAAGPDLPDDDPATDIDESAAADYGGVVAMVKAVRLFLDKIDGYYGPINGTPITSAADTKQFINAYFQTDDTAMNAAIDGYYTYRAANGRFVFQDAAAVTLYFFCNGSNEQAWGKWLVDQSGYPATKQAMMKTLTDALEDSFWTSYYATGITKPNYNYQDASCVPVPDETLLVPTMITTYTGAIVHKANHRLLITSSGHWQDVGGDIKDSWWFRAAAGTLTFQAANYTMTIGGTPVTKPSTNVVPYKSSHVYQYTIDTPAAGVFALTIPATSMDSPVTGSGLTLLIHDLGEISV